jgi:hypothetical protein
VVDLNILNELNALVRDQLDSFEKARNGSLTLPEKQEFRFRNEQIRVLLEQLESQFLKEGE